jgi:hypothetical protein
VQKNKKPAPIKGRAFVLGKLFEKPGDEIYQNPLEG